jgi:DMSO/TMAO reductase YedYZ molybdopterin-dependent catalytic subunit
MRSSRLSRVHLLLTLLPYLSAAQGQDVSPPKSPTSPGVLLRVIGDVPRPFALTADQIAQFPRRNVRATERGGKKTEFDGIALVELLKAAGVKFGDDLRGAALAAYLVVEAADGYRAVFALPELDPECTDRVVLLADRRDGKPLEANEGSFRVVVPGEKRHSRWVRQVIVLKVGRA